MNTFTHPVSPEEIMGFVDGELSAADAHSVAAHIESCVECGRLAAEFRSTSQLLSAWEIPAVPASVQEFVMPIALGAIYHRADVRPRSKASKWFSWAMGFAGVLALLYVMGSLPRFYRHEGGMNAPPPPASVDPKSEVDANRAKAIKVIEQLADKESSYKDEYGQAATSSLALNSSLPEVQAHAPVETTPAPMIARSVALTVKVKDVNAVRGSLDSLLTLHHSYFAQMTVNSPAGSSHSFQASLRVPFNELSSMLESLRALGMVESETQSGEEVTQQHRDLVTRLKNYRETEERLRAILAQRTGKITDVLQVEEEISRVRGEIERMEAEQTTLEHRVSYSSVDLQLVEQYTEPINAPADSPRILMRNALVDGYHHLTGTVLGIALFLLEFGPPLLLWFVVLGAPIVWLWRRYRRNR